MCACVGEREGGREREIEIDRDSDSESKMDICTDANPSPSIISSLQLARALDRAAAPASPMSLLLRVGAARGR